jgi:hypothetical protein
MSSMGLRLGNSESTTGPARLFDLTYDRFKEVESAVGSIYAVGGIALTLITALGASLVATADPKLFAGAAENPFNAIYAFALLFSALTWAFSACAVTSAVLPRHGYGNPPPMKGVLDRVTLAEPAEQSRLRRLAEVQLMDRFAAAEAIGRQLNEERRQTLGVALRWCAVCIGLLALANVAAFTSRVVHPPETQHMTTAPKQDEKIVEEIHIETRDGSGSGIKTK